MKGVCVSCSLKVAKQPLRLVCTSELLMTFEGCSRTVCAAKVVAMVVPLKPATDVWPTLSSPLTSLASSLRT